MPPQIKHINIQTTSSHQKLNREGTEAFIWTCKTETTYHSFLMEKSPMLLCINKLERAPGV